MKILLVALLCLLTFTSAHAQAWPRNPTTGKVEFKGTLPWPASAKTEAQRRALVRRWYLAKLTDETPQAVAESARTVVSPTLLTYAGLPIAVVIGSDRLPNHATLAYIIDLKPLPRGLSFQLSELQFSRVNDTHLGPELEQVLTADSVADRPALAALRRRLASALATW
ncbi:hypothetical protein [Hymenobacter cheonanensis]|uniref:hypothetical protein n=1 Tax=Hymenobacter sp. CA2-7 TaxID=3063993 RepID=UPI002713D533|nr:hypothetical protein [Hymenobacter sp. CA2-7]MDO7885992.1 hypothetical protein [Hymenobacter sp. CA2-7]